MDMVMSKKTIQGRITIDQEICKGCCLCKSVCPNEKISISKKPNQQGYYPAEFSDNENDGKVCIACGNCAIICPDIAIEFYRD